MRLLRRLGDSLSFTDFDDNIPPYVILSHTWGRREEEVTYQDLLAGKSNDKIEFLLDRAQENKIEYAWIDTCCINKHDFTELGKSINLMYEWYANATICYVYLTDVPQVSFAQSRWFTRGWTLQELLAPKEVRFYDRSTYLGTKEELALDICEATDIPQDVLRAQSSGSLVERFHWSVKRQTKEPEDKSYCLLGLLGVKLIIGYGLGAEDAQQRLLEAVGKRYGSVVVDEILRYAQDKPGAQHSRDSYVPGQLRESLAFQNMDSRRDAIERPVLTTCDWLLQTAACADWLSRGGFLWIKGHPGTGKSTLMKYADRQSRALNTPCMVQISYFFNARGAELDRTTIGMYRSLLVQLLDAVPNGEQYVCKHMHLGSIASKSWKVDDLKAMFKMLVKGLQVRCFVDALNECPTTEIKDMVSVFRSVAPEAKHFSICVASRYYPALSIKESIVIRLDQQEQHTRDLQRYVHDRLDTDDDEIKAMVVAKAKGVFMWAVLVVDLLNDELVVGDMTGIRKIVQKIPEQLDDIYNDILQRQDANLGRFQFCIQLILFAMAPMDKSAFYQALSFKLDRKTAVTMRKEYSMPIDQIIERFVISSSRGLAAFVVGDDSTTVQFVHESVRDYFLKHGGLQKLFPYVQQDIIAWSHNNIKTICQDYLEVEASFSQQQRPHNFAWLHPKHDSLAYLDYVCLSIVYHGEQAATDISQKNFVDKFDWEGLVHFRRVAGFDVTLPRNDNVGAIHLFAMNNAVQLVAQATRLGHQIDSELDGEAPLCFALGWGATAVVNQLLIYGASPNRRARDGRPILTLALWSNFINYNGQDIWIPRTGVYHEKFSRRLTDNSASILPQQDSEFDCMEMLLAYGCDANQADAYGETAIIVACRTKRYESVRVLLEYGADPDLADRNGITPLMASCSDYHNDKDLIHLIIMHSFSSIDRVDNFGRSALMKACSMLDVHAVRVLLAHGASVTLVDYLRENALMYAAQAPPDQKCVQNEDETTDGCEHTRVIEVLLHHGADPTAEDDFGRNAYHVAQLWRFHCTERTLKALHGFAPKVGRDPWLHRSVERRG